MSSRSGAEVRKALLSGTPVTWGFNPKEKRVELTLPESLGGSTHILCIAGSYTFTINEPIPVFASDSLWTRMLPNWSWVCAVANRLQALRQTRSVT
jgi:hypothetical protein